jgi:hypothetical protein
MKLFWKLGLVLTLVVVLSLAAAHLWLGSLIKDAVEWLGPKITQTSVTLDGVDVSLVGGQAQLEGLTVGNPPGFKASRSMRVEKAAVRLDWWTALSDRVVIEKIEIKRPEITVEGLLSRSNISVIQDNIKAFSSSAVAGGPGTAGTSPGRQHGTRKLQIKDLSITNGQVTLWLPAGSGGTKPTTVALPDIHLRDLGKRSGGVNPEELSLAIVDAMSHEVSRVVAKSARELGGTAEKVVSGALKEVSGLFGRK